MVKKQAETNWNFGKKPEERSVEELINYGIINLNKPKGPTSHQVSAYVQQILGINKSGHSGTLDPHVTGVLPIALGKATRIVQTLLKAGKEYVGIMHLHTDVEEKEIKKAAEEFTGKIEQLPPIRSAVKRRLRTREIYYLEILEIEGRDVLFKVGSEAGFYVRKFCLEPNTEIITTNGIKKIKDICEKKEQIKVFSFKNEKLSKNRIIDFQKIPFNGNLIEIEISLGIHLKVTPDHKLLVSTKEGAIMKEAKDITEGDFLFRIINLPIISKKIYISDLIDKEYMIHDNNLKLECKNRLIDKYHSIREFERRTNVDRQLFLKNSKIDIKIKHLKHADMFDSVKHKIRCFKTERGKIITVNPYLTKELLYLVGLVASDGNNTKEKNTQRYTRIKFHNIETELIEKFYKLTKSIFPSIKVTKKLVSKNLWQVETSNSLFATVCANLGVVSPSYKSDILPIAELEADLVTSFLKGYFDGDGTAYFKIKEKTKGAYTDIRFISVDLINVKRIHQMLLKLGIQNKIFKRNLDYSKFKTKNKFVYIISLKDPVSKLKFCNIIGSNHPQKRKILESITSHFIKEKDDISNYLYCPLDKTSYLKNIKYVNSGGGNVKKIIKDEKPFTYYVYNKLYSLNKKILPKIETIFTIEKVKKIKNINFKGHVYDITVEKDHNFLIENGIVSSNCHDFGLKLNTHAHMSQLVRTKAGPFSDKDWKTLHDLKDAFVLWKENKEETEIRKVILPIESAIQHIPKIWVLDSTVKTLCQGADLSIPGISKFNEFAENESIAVMSLKDELICLGDAVESSQFIQNNDKGKIVKTKKVFMERNTYKL